MTLYGADVEQLIALAVELEKAEERLNSSRSNVQAKALNNNQWLGPRAETFRSDWTGQHGPSMVRAAQQLRVVATILRNQAEEQRQASSIGSLPGGSGVSLGGSGAPGADGIYYKVLNEDGTYRIEKGISGSYDNGNFHSSFDGHAYAAGTFKSGGGIGPDGVRYELSAKFEAGVRADAEASYSTNGVEGKVHAYAEAEAHAEAKLKGSIGPDGASVNAGLNVGASATVGGDASVSAAGVTTTARGEVGVGLEFNAKADVDITVEHIKAKIEFGVILGVGGKGSIDIDIEPAKVIKEVGNALGAIGNESGKFISGVGNFFGGILGLGR